MKKVLFLSLVLCAYSSKFFAQCEEPMSIAFHDSGFYKNDTIFNDFVDNEPKELDIQIAIDTAKGVIAWSWLLSPESLENGDTTFTGVKYGKSEMSEYFYYYKNGKMSGPIFVIRKDGYYAKGFCKSDSCDVVEYYPNGSVFQEYKTGSSGMFLGERVTYGKTGKIIYRALYSIYEATDENVLKYCFGQDGVYRAAINGYIEVKEKEECW